MLSYVSIQQQITQYKHWPVSLHSDIIIKGRKSIYYVTEKRKEGRWRSHGIQTEK